MSKISLKHSGGNVVSLNSPTSAPTSADVAFKLPNADGSAGQYMKTDGSGNLAFATLPAAGGITMIDQHRLTTSFQGTAEPLANNLERCDDNYSSPALLGSQMTYSSGTWTFPATGMYEISATATAYINNDDNRENLFRLRTTTNNGTNWEMAAQGLSNGYNSGSNTWHSSHLTYYFDVTDVSTHKIQFWFSPNDSSTYYRGGTDQSWTYFLFKKLADT